MPPVVISIFDSFVCSGCRKLTLRPVPRARRTYPDEADRLCRGCLIEHAQSLMSDPSGGFG